LRINKITISQQQNKIKNQPQELQYALELNEHLFARMKRLFSKN
jgi:hypothetical protein